MKEQTRGTSHTHTHTNVGGELRLFVYPSLVGHQCRGRIAGWRSLRELTEHREGTQDIRLTRAYDIVRYGIYVRLEELYLP